jgi:hypothetical protein
MLQKKVMPLIMSNITVTDAAEAIKNVTTLQWVPRQGGSFPRGKTAGA